MEHKHMKTYFYISFVILFLILTVPLGYTKNNSGASYQWQGNGISHNKEHAIIDTTKNITSFSNDHADSVTFTTETTGPFIIGNNKSLDVFVNITRVHYPKTIAPYYPESDISLSITDADKTILLRKNFPATGEYEMTFSVRQEFIPSIGNVLVCFRQLDPSAPGSGEDYQIFGLNSLHQIVNISGIISTPEYKIAFLIPNYKAPIPVSPQEKLAKPFLESEHWTGNFTVLFYNSIYPDGFTYDESVSPYYFETTPVRIDTNEARQWRKRQKEDSLTITLFISPDSDSSKVIEIRPVSSIQFLNAVRRDRWWLHIVIDGQQGYICGEDFSKIGLPDAG